MYAIKASGLSVAAVDNGRTNTNTHLGWGHSVRARERERERDRGKKKTAANRAINALGLWTY